MERKQIDDGSEKVEDVLNELADVFSYLICLANECHVDIGDIDGTRPSKPLQKFSKTDWNEIEVTAFYHVKLDSSSTLLRDFIMMCYSATKSCDIIQWVEVEGGLANLSVEKQQKIDRYLKDLFCYIVVMASKYEYDLPRLLHEKNQRVAKKYANSVGKLSKDDVINERYAHLPDFQLSSEITTTQFDLDRLIPNPDCSINKLLAGLMEAHGLISEMFQWDTDGTKTTFTPVKRAHLSHQLAIILSIVMKLAQTHEVNLNKSFWNKLRRTGRRYPVEACRGSCVKYTELEKVEDCELTDTIANLEITDPVLTISAATSAFSKFVAERDWEQFHTPRNMTIQLLGEIGELIELFIGKQKPSIRKKKRMSEEEKKSEFLSCLSDELADCVISTVRLGEICKVDLTAAMMHYFPASAM